MKTPTQDPPRRGRPPRLTREQVARAALAFIDRYGLDELSMPRLARELGVGTMTLYGYVQDKDELLDAVVDVAVADLVPPSDGQNWRDAIENTVVAVHDLLTLHPAIVAIRLRQPVVRPEALRFAEVVGGHLLSAGLRPDVAASSFRLLFTYVFGYAAISPASATEADRQTGAEAIARLDAARNPVLTSHASAFAKAMSGEDEFRFGLNLILDAVESLA